MFLTFSPPQVPPLCHRRPYLMCCLLSRLQPLSSILLLLSTRSLSDLALPAPWRWSVRLSSTWAFPLGNPCVAYAPAAAERLRGRASRGDPWWPARPCRQWAQKRELPVSHAQRHEPPRQRALAVGGARFGATACSPRAI